MTTHQLFRSIAKEVGRTAILECFTCFQDILTFSFFPCNFTVKFTVHLGKLLFLGQNALMHESTKIPFLTDKDKGICRWGQKSSLFYWFQPWKSSFYLNEARSWQTLYKWKIRTSVWTNPKIAKKTRDWLRQIRKEVLKRAICRKRGEKLSLICEWLMAVWREQTNHERWLEILYFVFRIAVYKSSTY